MSRILFTVWPFTGHMYPTLAIAEELQKLGHGVAFYTGSKFRSTVEAAGFSFYPLRNVDENLIEEIVLSPRGIMSVGDKPFKLRALWRKVVLDSAPGQLKDLDEVLAIFAPDGIVCDPMMWAPFLILHETRKMPVAIFAMIPACHLSGRDGPIIGFPGPRAHTGIERLRARLLRGISGSFLHGIRRGADRLRHAHGLSPLPCSVTDFAGRMPLYLVPGSAEFDYSRDDLPPSVHYVGPCLWKNPQEDQLPDWIAGLPDDQPLIYASEGTVHLEPVLLRAVGQAAKGLPVQVILTTGRHREAASVGLGAEPLPPNIHVEQWVPLQPLLPRLSAVVTIGGPSTMLAAFEAGVPVVIVPFSWDHPETGWRVEASGAGIRLSPKNCTAENMRRALERILSEPSFRQNAQRLANDFKRCGGAPTAARLIEGLVSGGKSPQPRTNA